MKIPNEGQNNVSDKPSIIKENTLIPLSLLFIIVAGVVRVETTNFKTSANEKEITDIKIRELKTSNDISDIKTSIAKIEGYMNAKSQAQSEEQPHEKSN